jgi:hypothetical protein
MAVKRIPFDYVLDRTAVVGTNDLVSPIVEAGWVYCVQHVTIENLTSNYTSLRIIKVVAGREHVVAFHDTCVAGEPDWYDYPIWITEGQYGLVRMAGCVANDLLRVYISGYKQLLPDYWEVG